MAVVLEMRQCCGQEPTEQTSGTMNSHREAGSSKKPNHHSCIGAIDIVCGIHMNHIRAFCRQQKEAGTLREIQMGFYGRQMSHL